MSTVAPSRLQVINRQLRVLQLLSQRWPNKRIAEYLGVTRRTVNRDCRQLRYQYGFKTQLELVVAAFKAGQEVLGER